MLNHEYPHNTMPFEIHECIVNLASIQTNIPDTSDYHNFCTAAIEHIISHTKNHKIYKKTLEECISKFVNEDLLQITYRMINVLTKAVFVTEELLYNHLQYDTLRDEVYLYVSKLMEFETVSEVKANNSSTTASHTKVLLKIEDTIEKHLIDPFYISDIFIDLLQAIYSAKLQLFCNVEKPELLEKQVHIMTRTEQFQNIDYFLSFIGSKNNLQAHLSSTLVQHCIKNKIDILDSKFICVQDGKLYMKGGFDIENANNFLYFFFECIEEQEHIINCLKTKNYSAMQNIIKKYGKCKDLITKDRRFELIGIKRVFRYKKVEKTEIRDYGYLFNNISYKQCMDCLEI